MVDWIPCSIEYWQLDPAIVARKAGGPNHVRNVKDLSIFYDRPSITDSCHARHTLNTRLKEIFRRDPNHRMTSPEFPSSLYDPTSKESIHSEMLHQRFEEDHPKFITNISVVCRDKTSVAAGQPHWVL